MNKPTKAQTERIVALINKAGNIERQALADFLRVDVRNITRWINGEVLPSLQVYWALQDFVAAD